MGVGFGCGIQYVFGRVKMSIVPHKLRLSLTQVEHVGFCDEGHEEDSRGKRHHADQDEHHIADAATEHKDTEETGEKNHAARSVPITHLEESETKQHTMHMNRPQTRYIQE